MTNTIKKVYNLILEIIKERKLLIELSKKDFKRRFVGSYFGVVWAFIQPMLTILVYWFVFQYGFRSGSVDGKPFIIWFICGITPWLFISEAFSTASNSFLEYSYLVKKVIFNINILPMVKIVSSLLIHLFFVLISILLAAFFGIYPTIYLLQLVYYIFCSVVFIFAISLLFSSVLVFFRDLNQIINILLLVGMWGTPIAWNISMFPENIQFILKLNPFYYIVDGYRDSILSGTWFWQKYNLTLYFWIVTLVLLIFGTWIYNKLKSHFADVL